MKMCCSGCAVVANMAGARCLFELMRTNQNCRKIKEKRDAYIKRLNGIYTRNLESSMPISFHVSAWCMWRL